jgi:hypothetical protein
MLHPHRGLGASLIHNSRNTRIDLQNFVLRRSRPQRLLRKHAKCLEDHIGRLVANRCLSVFLGGFEPQRQSPPSDLSRMAKFAMSDALPGQIPMDILPTLPLHPPTSTRERSMSPTPLPPFRSRLSVRALAQILGSDWSEDAPGCCHLCVPTWLARCYRASNTQKAPGTIHQGSRSLPRVCPWAGSRTCRRSAGQSSLGESQQAEYR